MLCANFSKIHASGHRYCSATTDVPRNHDIATDTVMEWYQYFKLWYQITNLGMTCWTNWMPITHQLLGHFPKNDNRKCYVSFYMIINYFPAVLPCENCWEKYSHESPDCRCLKNLNDTIASRGTLERTLETKFSILPPYMKLGSLDLKWMQLSFCFFPSILICQDLGDPTWVSVVRDLIAKWKDV